MNELIAYDEKGNAIIPQDVIENIINIERDLKAMQEAQKQLKTKLTEEMEAFGIIKFSNDQISIKYVTDSDRESFDIKSFKDDFPELYDKYVRISTVKPSVRITIK